MMINSLPVNCLKNIKARNNVQNIIFGLEKKGYSLCKLQAETGISNKILAFYRDGVSTPSHEHFKILSDFQEKIKNILQGA